VDEPDAPRAEPVAHKIQERALEALELTRNEGFSAGMVVLATGLGKTFLAAFDSCRKRLFTGDDEFPHILFVAHREEILTQAMETFRRFRPTARFGRFDGQERRRDVDVLFASIQTLGTTHHLQTFAQDAFDYIVVDEFHHAAAPSYRALIDHFAPKFLLGITATPDRLDGGDLLGLCQENLVFTCDLFEGIERGLLAPFHYFGVADEIDYANIPWRNGRFDIGALETRLATEARAQNALDQHRRLTPARGRTLGFCCSQQHADFMARYFADRGLRTAAVHSGKGSAPRGTSLQRLRSGDLDVVFAVDMFNEGVDVPEIDTILMLRPTESTTIWLQQFGRGLRRAEGKDHLTVIDYIGNHRAFLTKVHALLAPEPGDRALRDKLDDYAKGDLKLPPGCEVTYDLEAIDLLRSLLRPPTRQQSFEAMYRELRLRSDDRPKAIDMFHAGFDPRNSGQGSWFEFVRRRGDLDSEESEILSRFAAVLDVVATTVMNRSYKMVLLRALQRESALPGSISIDRLTQAFAEVASSNPRLRSDVSAELDDPRALRTLIVNNPIEYLIGPDPARSPFLYSDGVFSTTFIVPEPLRAAFDAMVRELIDWRLAAYLSRGGGEPA
jgi:superfamily II DNA or RNA helicase